MPRDARDLPPNSVSHLIDRGVERRNIFLRPKDYLFFLSQMREVFDAYRVAVLNFVLMPNHFHIQALSGLLPVGNAMQKLLTRYALYFNREYERVGHLFQNRFKSYEVRDEDYLVQLPVYISRNPTRAGLVTRPQDWEWSGHNELASGKTRYLDLSRLEEVTGMPADEWREDYLEHIGREVTPPGAGATLEDVLRLAAIQAGISARDLRAGAKGAPYTMARRLVAREAVTRGCLRVNIAEVLGCAPSAVTRLLED